jgi:hypothetical protein
MKDRGLTNVLILLALGTIVLSGCNRPVCETKSADRRTHIHSTWSRFAERDAAGTERMGMTFNLMRQRRSYHQEHLEKTSALVRKEMKADEVRWREERAKRRAFAYDQWHGDPDAIPGTWARIVLSAESSPFMERAGEGKYRVHCRVGSGSHC